MTISKRILDIFLAILLLIILSPIMFVIALLILLRDGRPIIYKSERMKTPETGFLLWKFRTMSVVETDSGVSGGDKTGRISPLGGKLRQKRLDELPQLWNILRGDISFVGPRPPLREYVELFPSLYQQVLRSRPGVTGLATLAFHKREEELLAECSSAEETEAVYRRRCVPVKARLDLIYQENRSDCYDLSLMLATVSKKVNTRGKIDRTEARRPQ